MALAKKAGTTATATPSGNRVVSINRETFVRGGLRDDFKGVTANSAYFPWLANKKQHEETGAAQQWRLALTFDIYPDDAGENEEPERAIYGVADLKYFVPSNDGQNPAGATDEEYLALATSGGEIDDAEMYRGMLPIYIGTSKNPKHGFLPLGTNFEFLEAKLEECFEAAGVDAAGRLVPGLDPSDARQFDGLYCHWNRLPVPGRTMRQDTSGKGNVKAGDVLVPTEFIERRADSAPAASPKATGAATVTATAKPAPATTAGKVELQVDDTLQQEIAGDILTTLATADEGGTSKNDLVKALLPSYADKARRTALLLCLNSIPWLAADDKTWTYDGDTGLLSL